jgi:hypothetical protein
MKKALQLGIITLALPSSIAMRSVSSGYIIGCVVLREEEVEAMNLPPQPKGYREFLEDKEPGQVETEERPVHRATVSRKPSFLAEYRNKLIFGAIVVVAVVLLYYVVSPYQNCVREFTVKGTSELAARMRYGPTNTW